MFTKTIQRLISVLVIL